MESRPQLWRRHNHDRGRRGKLAVLLCTLLYSKTLKGLIEMAKPEDIRAAYEKLEAAKETLHQAEEARIEAAQTREEKFLDAINEAQADGITDPGKQQQKAMRATREQLTALHLAEKESRKAQHCYTMAGIRVDSLNRQLEAEKAVSSRGGD